MKSLPMLGLSLGVATAVLCAPRVALADRAADADKRAQHVEERFKGADKNKDGKLSRAEAEAEGGMPRIARNFDKIDKEKKGYVTVEQVKAFAFAVP
jgi:Ca2+-binding EF-hand superfamily protein